MNKYLEQLLSDIAYATENVSLPFIKKESAREPPTGFEIGIFCEKDPDLLKIYKESAGFMLQVTTAWTGKRRTSKYRRPSENPE